MTILGEHDVPHARRAWLYAAVGLVLVFLVAPVAIVVPMSFSGGRFLEFPPSSWSLRWYRAYFGSPDWRDATIVSLQAAMLTTAVATPVGVLAAYSLALSGSRVAGLIRMLIITPIIIPVILIAIGLFYAYARAELLGTMTGLVLAHTVLAVPFVMLTVGASLARFDFAQERVARSLGASRSYTFLHVILPQIVPAVVAGALFAFITSFDEVVVALFITGGEHSTLTRRMFVTLRDEIDPTIAAISTILIALSILVLAATQLLAREPRNG